MDTEKSPSSTQYFQKKFQKWFGDPVPSDPPFQTEAEHSIGDLDPTNLPFPADSAFQTETEHSFGDLDSTDQPFPTEVYLSYYQTQGRSKYDLQKLSKLLSFGFSGAVLLGAVVSFIILTINISFLGLYGFDWPGQFVVIFLAVAVGFWGGLFKKSIDMVHEKHSFKDRL